MRIKFDGVESKSAGVPNCCQQSRTVFILKAGRALLQEIKDLKQLSVTSFACEILEGFPSKFLDKETR